MVIPEEARAELARRELARRYLVDFSCYMAPWYKVGRHHRLVASALEKVKLFIETGGKEGIGRLMIFEPPQNGKSEQVSKFFPAWLLGNLPDSHIILTSYNADLATKNSRAARDYVLDKKYTAVFGELSALPIRFTDTGEELETSPVRLSEEVRSATDWKIAAPHRGGVHAAGVGGGLTGNPAHLLVVDDPFKSRDEAESDLRREFVEDWYVGSVRDRLRPGGAMVIMHTRWHEDDLAGKRIKAMIQNEKADQWVIIDLHAIWENPVIPEEKTFDEYKKEMLYKGIYLNEKDPLGRSHGEELWPEEYDLAWLEATRASIGEYEWWSKYQQQPYSRTGNFFRREWFTVVEAAPKLDEIIARMWFWDKAGSQEVRRSTNYACGGVMSLTKDELVYVENVTRRQCTPGERDDMMVKAMKADLATGRPIGCIWHQQDPGSAGLDSAQATNRLLVKAGFGKIRFETVTGSKEVRADPWSSALQGGQVRLVRAAWNNPFIEEHVGFPKAMFDDQVDFASWGYSKLVGRRGRKEARSYQG